MRLNKYKLLVIVIGLLSLLSCSSNEYKKIPLENLDPELKYVGGIIVKDILESINHEKGARYLLNKDYITPMVHGRIMHNIELYKETYLMTSLTIGKVSTYKLFEVVNKRIVKTMRYKLQTDSNQMKFIELKIDINKEYNLADYYLYVTSNDGMLKRQNILPSFRK